MGHCDIEQISAYIDGEMPEENAALLRSHIDECPSCRAVYDDFLAIKNGFAAIEVKPPDTLTPGILYKISLGAEPPRKRRIIKSLIGVAACLAAALAVSQTILPQDSVDNYYGLVGADGDRSNSAFEMAEDAPEAPERQNGGDSGTVEKYFAITDAVTEMGGSAANDTSEPSEENESGIVHSTALPPSYDAAATPVPEEPSPSEPSPSVSAAAEGFQTAP